ncbi:hypothetical protein H8D85_01315 [bacterium]|nr:hypothetical protein [bacterium]
MDRKKPPGIFGKGWNMARAIARYAANRFENVDKPTYMERMNACNSCEHINKDKGSCNVCGCDVSMKGKWATEDCPKGFWSKVKLNKK